jgi:hypothetical protein
MPITCLVLINVNDGRGKAANKVTQGANALAKGRGLREFASNSGTINQIFFARHRLALRSCDVLSPRNENASRARQLHR